MRTTQIIGRSVIATLISVAASLVGCSEGTPESADMAPADLSMNKRHLAVPFRSA